MQHPPIGERPREKVDTSGAIVLLVLGIVFALFALACLAGAAYGVTHDARTSQSVFVAVFGAFWIAMSTLMIRLRPKTPR